MSQNDFFISFFHFQVRFCFLHPYIQNISTYGFIKFLSKMYFVLILSRFYIVYVKYLLFTQSNPFKTSALNGNPMVKWSNSYKKNVLNANFMSCILKINVKYFNINRIYIFMYYDKRLVITRSSPALQIFTLLSVVLLFINCFIFKIQLLLLLFCSLQF